MALELRATVRAIARTAAVVLALAVLAPAGMANEAGAGSRAGPTRPPTNSTAPTEATTWERYRRAMTSYEGLAPASGHLSSPAQSAPAPREYTLDTDFDEGVMVGVNHDYPNNDQLQLDETPSTFPFIWVAASGRDTVVRIDTVTGDVLGEYPSCPNGRGGNPSRTTVDLNGAVWVGNRAESAGGGSVVHIGLLATGGCVDRNGNGIIDTSSGLGDILPWSNRNGADDTGGVSTAADECIVDYIRVPPVAVRTIAVDSNNDVWIGGHSDNVHVLLNGETGQIRERVNAGCGGYGGLVDANGVLWSSGFRDLLYLDATRRPIECHCVNTLEQTTYGLGLNLENYVWASSFSGDSVVRYSPSGMWVSVHPTGGASGDRGVAVTPADNHVWVANSSGMNVSRLDEDGNLVEVIEVGQTPTGVAVDQAGKVWVTNLGSDSVSRIDPATNAQDLSVGLGPGAAPYNYSDMTGMVSRSFTTRRGTWLVIHDSGQSGTRWGTITWTSSEPPWTSIRVRARAAERASELGAASWQDADSGIPMSPVVGRYLQVEAILNTQVNGITPILYDLTVWPGAGPTATPSPTVSPSATPTLLPTPTPTPTPRPRPIYLPLSLKEECPTVVEHADIALVVDASTSMLDETAQGTSKIDATKEAIEAFLDLIRLPDDRVAIVAFNRTAWIAEPLTGDRQALSSALDDVDVAQQTRTDLALQLATQILREGKAQRPESRSVMVVLTDGLPNPVSGAEVIRVADLIKSEHMSIFTIGLGTDVNAELLRRIASSPGDYYASPAGDDLEALYRRIARVLRCPSAVFWPER